MKVFLITSLYGSSSWVPRGTNLLFTSCCSPCLLVLCCITECLRRTYLPHVSYVSWHPFRVVSIPLQLCCASRGSRTFGSLWGSRPSPFHWTLSFLSSDLGGLDLFLSSLCFMGSKACPFMDFGLQVFWAYHPLSLWWAQPF